MIRTRLLSCLTVLAALIGALLAPAAPAGAQAGGHGGSGLTGQQRAQLYAIARDTWKFYATDLDPTTHLPLDNIGPGNTRAVTPRRPTSGCTCGR